MILKLGKKKDVYGYVEDLIIGEIILQDVKFKAYKYPTELTVCFIGGDYQYSINYDENKSLLDLLIEAIKKTPIEEKSIIKTNVYLKDDLVDCDGEAFNKLVNVEVRKSELDGFINMLGVEDKKCFIIPLSNIELIETIYEPIFKDL
jgi:hypothetical protein